MFTVALVRIAGERYRQPDELFEPGLIERLSGGDVPAAVLERLSKDVDEYLLQLLGRLGASPADQVSALRHADARAAPVHAWTYTGKVLAA